ncbi:MAG: type II toxin-antitoxin system HicB family antitoxin [Clostridia bacterium]|nr:type II toxin-antitoxin system HicB family antitoxin [Clostridia bacterium]
MKKPDTYVYPAIFTYEEGQISVTWPDLPGCVTCGDTEQEALLSAKEAMGGHLWCMEEDDDPIPEPSSLENVILEANERPVLIDVFMPAIRMAKENRSVSRTITLPAWLNAVALSKGVNFSQVLQKALMEQLGVGRR